MDEMLPDEIPAVRDSIRRFMETEVVPVMDEYEKRRELPRDIIRKAGEAGYYGATFPEEVGGSDMGYLAAAVIIEEIARMDVPVWRLQPEWRQLPGLHLPGRDRGADREIRARPSGGQGRRHDGTDRTRRRI